MDRHQHRNFSKLRLTNTTLFQNKDHNYLYKSDHFVIKRKSSYTVLPAFEFCLAQNEHENNKMTIFFYQAFHATTYGGVLQEEISIGK